MTLSEFLSKPGAPSTAQFAERIGVSPVSVTRYSAGTRIPTKQHMLRIAEETDHVVTANDFFGLRHAAPTDLPPPFKEGASA